MCIKITQNFRADFKTVGKNVKDVLTKKLKGKKVFKIGVCPLLY